MEGRMKRRRRRGKRGFALIIWKVIYCSWLIAICMNLTYAFGYANLRLKLRVFGVYSPYFLIMANPLKFTKSLIFIEMFAHPNSYSIPSSLPLSLARTTNGFYLFISKSKSVPIPIHPPPHRFIHF
jgi:hypothetical protein